MRKQTYIEYEDSSNNKEGQEDDEGQRHHHHQQKEQQQQQEQQNRSTAIPSSSISLYPDQEEEALAAIKSQRRRQMKGGGGEEDDDSMMLVATNSTSSSTRSGHEDTEIPQQTPATKNIMMEKSADVKKGAPIDNDEEDDGEKEGSRDFRERRLAMNRVSAKLRRDRKRKYLVELELKTQSLMESNENLMSENAKIKKEITQVRHNIGSRRAPGTNKLNMDNLHLPPAPATNSIAADTSAASGANSISFMFQQHRHRQEQRASAPVRAGRRIGVDSNITMPPIQEANNFGVDANGALLSASTSTAGLKQDQVAISSSSTTSTNFSAITAPDLSVPGARNQIYDQQDRPTSMMDFHQHFIGGYSRRLNPGLSMAQSAAYASQFSVDPKLREFGRQPRIGVIPSNYSAEISYHQRLSCGDAYVALPHHSGAGGGTRASSTMKNSSFTPRRQAVTARTAAHPTSTSTAGGVGTRAFPSGIFSSAEEGGQRFKISTTNGNNNKSKSSGEGKKEHILEESGREMIEQVLVDEDVSQQEQELLNPQQTHEV